MTRYRLLRLAQISAAVLGPVILGAALAQATVAGLASVARLLTVLGASGAVASLGWHGTAILLERHEDRKRAERRHRVPRPDRVPVRSAAPADAADAWPDPYAPDAEPPGQGFARYYLNDELHVHHPAGLA